MLAKQAEIRGGGDLTAEEFHRLPLNPKGPVVDFPVHALPFFQEVKGLQEEFAHERVLPGVPGGRTHRPQVGDAQDIEHLQPVRVFQGPGKSENQPFIV